MRNIKEFAKPKRRLEDMTIEELRYEIARIEVMLECLEAGNIARVGDAIEALATEYGQV
jgi:hypothetical protein